MRTNTQRVAGVVAVAAVLLTGCGDAEPGDDETTPATTETSTDEPTEDGTAAAGATVTVTAVDYAYADLTAEIEVGTTVVLQNDSEAEVHEILAILLPEDETRSADELAALPEEELGALVANLRGVALAPPGADSSALPAPPLTLAEPGRYLFVCAIPTGAPADDVMAAVQAFIEAGGEDPAGPAYPETGPPHFANGMYAEVTVTG